MVAATATLPMTKALAIPAMVAPGKRYRIALSGKAGSGKTTLAKRLVEDFGFARLSFAGALKEELTSLLGLGLPEFEADKRKWRPLLQVWGSARRDVSEGYWVRKLLVRLPVNRGSPVVIDDLRYENEAQALKREGFYLVRLDCPSLDSIRYLRGQGMGIEEADVIRMHPSETDLDGYDQFDLVLEAPRSRHLDTIYDELVGRIGWKA